MVVRDDSGLTGTNRFQALGAEGATVARSVPITVGQQLGAERLGSDLSIAVDPNNPRRVVVAYGEVLSSGQTIIVLTESLDGGVNWTERFTTSPDLSAGLPALAINDDGIVGELYEVLDSKGQLETHFFTFLEIVGPNPPSNFPNFITYAAGQDMTILSFPNNNPPGIEPYVGDYFDLQAVGSSFYGTFSGSNDLNSASFPFGVQLQREFDFDPGTGVYRLLDLNGNPISPSIDPYFFSITVVPGECNFPPCS